MLRITEIIIALFLIFLFSTAVAEGIIGNKTITLRSNDEAIVIGHVEISLERDGVYFFVLKLAEQNFGNYFLAMRPFKCLTGIKQHLCHYAYKDTGHFTADDLTELEYALLFLHKPLSAVHIDPWNGVYYKMRIENDRIIGDLYDVDLNRMVAPEKEESRPIRKEHLNAADPNSHWLTYLEIQ